MRMVREKITRRITNLSSVWKAVPGVPKSRAFQNCLQGNKEVNKSQEASRNSSGRSNLQGVFLGEILHTSSEQPWHIEVMVGTKYLSKWTQVLT